jgi:hypothetical protein
MGAGVPLTPGYRPRELEHHHCIGPSAITAVTVQMWLNIHASSAGVNSARTS